MSKKNKTTSKSASTPVSDPDLVPLTQAMPRKTAAKGKGSKAKAAKAKAADAKPTKLSKPAKADKPKRPSGLDSAAQVLKDAGTPMRCKDMVDKMLADGLWKTEGRTPAATIYAAILREITTKGGDARFKKTDRGLFAFNGK
ncbi:MAG: winged helix-turn-helix domain-containing protein [Planctomycetaceae bacterium]|nr:winged helix-turn-helix domain-containing protein [Planctomycetaceae bacterium]